MSSSDTKERTETSFPLPLVIEGKSYTNSSQFLHEIKNLKDTVPENALIDFIGHSAIEVQEWVCKQQWALDEFVTEFVNTAESVCPHMPKSGYAVVWHRLRRIRDAQQKKRAAKALRRQNKVITAWGVAGEYLFRLTSAQKFTSALNSVATAYPNWHDARHFINRVIYNRRINPRRGQSHELVLGTADAHEVQKIALAALFLSILFFLVNGTILHPGRIIVF